MNHLDFELAVGKIDTLDYNERTTQHGTHFNGSPNEIWSTSVNREASVEPDKATEPLRSFQTVTVHLIDSW